MYVCIVWMKIYFLFSQTQKRILQTFNRGRTDLISTYLWYNPGWNPDYSINVASGFSPWSGTSKVDLLPTWLKVQTASHVSNGSPHEVYHTASPAHITDCPLMILMFIDVLGLEQFELGHHYGGSEDYSRAMWVITFLCRNINRYNSSSVLLWKIIYNYFGFSRLLYHDEKYGCLAQSAYDAWVVS